LRIGIKKEKQVYGALTIPGSWYISIFRFSVLWDWVVSLCTTRFNIRQLCTVFSPHSACMCFVWTSVQTVIIFLHSMKQFVFINPTQRICYSRKWEYLNII